MSDLGIGSDPVASVSGSDVNLVAAQGDDADVRVVSGESDLEVSDDLLEIDSAEWVSHVRTGSAALQYTQAWGLVHFFLYAREGRWQKQFLSFLEQLNQGWDLVKVRLTTG